VKALVSGSRSNGSPREPFWRNPSGGQIIAAVITTIGAIAIAFISVRAGGGDETSTPTPSSTPASVATPGSPTTARRGTRLLSPEGIKVTASSTLPKQGANTYLAANTLDGDPQTAWSEGRQGPGIGATLTWTFPEQVDLRRVLIVNGYAKGNLFRKNLRIRAARVTTAQGETTITLRDTTSYQPLRIRKGSTTFMRLAIVGVYGSRTYEDCLLSEIEFFVADS
jgi:hypothetical protein